MGDGDGSDGSSGDGGGGGAGFFDAGSFNAPSYSAPVVDSSAGLSSMFDDDIINKLRNQGFNLEGAYVNQGNGADNTGSQVYAPLDQGLLSSIGYKGDASDIASGSGENQTFIQNPEFRNYLAQNGYQLGVKDLGGGNMLTQTFGKGGNAVGQGSYWNQSAFDSPEFGAIVGLLAAAGGGLAAGGLAAGAGYGAGTAVGSAASGAGAGFAGTLSQTADVGQALKGAAYGGLTGGAIGAVNPAGMAGVTDPMYARAINSASGAGLNAGLHGGNIGGSVLNSLATSGLSAAGNYGLGMLGDNQGGLKMPDSSGYDFGGSNDFRLNGGDLGLGVGNYGMPDNLGSFTTNPYTPQPSSFNYGSPNDFNMAGSGLGLGGGPDTMQTPSGLGNYGSNPYTQAQAPSAPTQEENPVKAGLMKALNAGGQALGQPGRMDTMASGLMDLFNRYRQNQASRSLSGNLSSLYGQNSPYAQQLAQTLLRHDAASGRRSQVGPRSVELQARLAELNSRNAPMLNQLNNQQAGNSNAMLGDIFRMMSNQRGGGGGLGMLQSMFAPAPSMGGLTGYNPASDYNYQNGSDIGG